MPICIHAEKLQENGTGNIADIAKAIVTYFPKARGKVSSVDASDIVIQSENETGLSAGILLSVYREGEPFYHPDTKVLLGHFEDKIAGVEVVNVSDGQITARVIGETIPAVASLAGSLVRLTAASIPMRVSGGAGEENRFLIHELGLALEETGRFAISKDPLYDITVITLLPLVKIQMKNVKTGKIVADIETSLQAVDESDSIFESLQQKLFEKQQKGIVLK